MGKNKKKWNMYKFTVCWNDIKYIYVSHIVYNLTNWYRFYLKFMYGEGEKIKRREGKEVYTSLNSVYFIHVGIFFLLDFSFGLQNARLRIKAGRKSSQSKEEIGKGKKFLSSSCVHTCLVPYIKKGTWMFFHYISCEFSFVFPYDSVYTAVGWMPSREIYLCAYDQGPNKRQDGKESFPCCPKVNSHSSCESSHVCFFLRWKGIVCWWTKGGEEKPEAAMDWQWIKKKERFSDGQF